MKQIIRKGEAIEIIFKVMAENGCLKYF